MIGNVGRKVIETVREDGDRQIGIGEDLLRIIGVSLAWGFGTGVVVFLVVFFGALLIGGTASLGPLAAFIVGPASFVIALFVARSFARSGAR